MTASRAGGLDMKLNPLIALAGLFLTGLNGIARADELDLQRICENKAPSAGPSLRLVQHEGEDLILVDHGFCEIYRSSLSMVPPESSGWKIRFYASHSFTHYFNSNVTFHSSKYNIEIKDYEWAERGSREFFNPNNWFKDGKNPAQIIDEPTNTFTLSIEKNGDEFYLSAFHPKFLQADNQIKQITGTIDGVPVNGVLPVRGESRIIRNQFTYGQMIFEAGYSHRFVLIRSRLGNITYIPKVGVGVQIGKNLSTIAKPGQWWDAEDSHDQFRYQGFGASVSNRIELNSKNERVGIFYENRLGYYDTTAKFFDGTQHFGLGFVGNNFGVKFVLFHARPKSTI